jgi:hypothetical protein
MRRGKVAAGMDMFTGINGLLDVLEPISWTMRIEEARQIS